MGPKSIGSPVKRASGLPLTQAEREREGYFRNERLAREREFLRLCRQLGLPPGQPSRSLRRLWARMTGEHDEVA